ncbi:hypothetical protein D3C81_1650360 [compost metagenome]
MEPIPVRCRIPDLLHRLGKNQSWLSDMTGIDKYRISEYVNLRSYRISLPRAVLIAHHLRCSVDDLFEWDI